MSKIFCAVLMSIALVTPAFAEDMYGVFLIVKPDVKVKRASQVLVPKNGDKVFPGDTIATTGVGGRAKIKMKDGNIISVSPNTVFTVSAYSNDGDSKNVEIKLKTGKIRSEVNVKYDGQKNKFLIKTPTAVAGVRGTDFITSFNKNTRVTEVVTIHGSVALSSISNRGAATLVNMGQTASVTAGSQTPEAPRPAAPEQINEINKEFDSSGNGPGDANKDLNTNAPTGGEGAANDSGSGDSRQPASDSSTGSGANRIGDAADQSDSTFNQNVDAGKTAPSVPTDLVPNRPPVPAASNPVKDASQGNQLQRKTKVTIRPIVN